MHVQNHYPISILFTKGLLIALQPFPPCMCWNQKRNILRGFVTHRMLYYRYDRGIFNNAFYLQHQSSRSWFYLHLLYNQWFSSDGTLNGAPCQVYPTPWHEERLSGFRRRVVSGGPPRKLQIFKTDHILHVLMVAAVTWLKYCRYGVKHYPINQSKIYDTTFAEDYVKCRNYVDTLYTSIHTIYVSFFLPVVYIELTIIGCKLDKFLLGWV